MAAPAALIPIAICGALLLKKKKRRGTFDKKDKYKFQQNKIGKFVTTDHRHNTSFEVSELWIHENVVNMIESVVSVLLLVVSWMLFVRFNITPITS